jgi:1-acyl-sn-glycerol-3-phosphate acyltransferase
VSTPGRSEGSGLPVSYRVVVDRVRRLGEPAGATKPRRRVPIDPGALVSRLPRRRGFPLAKPTWPGTVPQPPVVNELGGNYDSDWARRYPARMARLLLTEAVTRPVVAALSSPEVHGMDRIAHLRGPAIFAANHSSHVDTPLLISVIPDRWRNRLVVAGAADYFFDTKFKAATFALLLNAVPIERQRVDRKSANRLATLLNEGWSLVIFPEGGRSPDGWGQPHSAGAAWLAARTGRPIVPIHIEGTHPILPKGRTKIVPGRAHVTFGRPLRGGPDESRDLAARLERAIEALADEQASDWWSATRRAARQKSPALTGPDAAAPWRRAWGVSAREREQRRDNSPRWPKL